jgi:hypothetical protein
LTDCVAAYRPGVPEVHDFFPVDEGFEQAGSVLVSDGSAWLTKLASVALVGSERIAVEFGDARMIQRSVVVPVRWSADNGPFRTLDGDLRLDPMPTRHSHLSFSGSYEVSPNGNDETTDQYLTESAVRRFMTEVAAALERGDTR